MVSGSMPSSSIKDGRGVPQSVELDVRDSCSFAELLEVAGDVLRSVGPDWARGLHRGFERTGSESG
jgi:hypothetical protein